MPASGDTTARMLRQRFEWLTSFTDDELQELTICSEQEGLKEGDTYFDLSHPERGPFQARVGESVPPGSCYVAKSMVSREAWSKLTRPPFGGTELRM